MNEENHIDWYGIRTVYHFGKKKYGTNLFEERICVFSGKDSDEAFEKAQQEADEYVKGQKMTWYPLQESYLQDGDPLIDGYEVYSEVFEFDGDLETFYKERYARYDYTPDD